MHYMTISFTHKNTSIQMREKLAFADKKSKMDILTRILSCSKVNEALIVSTCNRVEIIASVEECKESLKHILSEIALITLIEKGELEKRADVYEDSGAVHHIFSVASSLDSLVIGETQIAGQLKEAFRFAYEKGFCSQKLSRLLHKTFTCAARVREGTDISKNPISVSSVAVSKAKELMGELGGLSAVVIGAGEMATLAAKHLIACGVNTIIISRDYEKASNLAHELGALASAESIVRLKEFVNRYRLIFSATSSNVPIITDSIIEPKEFKRYFFDIAVPRDIELSQNEHIGVFAVDDLQEIVLRNLSLREEEAQKAYTIIRESTNEFYKWLQTLAIEPLIKEVRLIAQYCVKKEVAKAIKKGYLRGSDAKEAEKLVHQVFNSFLHRPTEKLRDMAKLPEADTIAQAMQYIFDINEDHSKNINHYKCEYKMETKI